MARRAVITGANSGIGLATATELAARGWEVVPACRTEAKSREAAAAIAEEVPGTSAVRCLEAPCELGDLRSVGRFGKALRDLGAPVDALILDAGIDGAPFELTAQGQELHFAVNHLGHFGLWSAVQPLLPDSSRVVSVTSSAALEAELVLDDLAWERRPYGRHAAYATSKACNVLFVDELARRSKTQLVNAVDPGPTASMIVRYNLPARAEQRREMTPKQIARQARMLRMKTPQQAAAGLVWLADAAEAGQATGNWFNGPGTLFPVADVPWRTEAAAKELWERSEALVRPYVL